MMSGIASVLGPVTPIDAADGIALIPSPAPLQRANWFDGKFLRASHLQAEQEYMLRLAHLVGMAGGGGVVNGFDVALAGAGMTLGAGFALDDLGRPLLLPTGATIDLDKLVAIATGGIADTKPASTGADAVFGDCFDASATSSGGQVVSSADWWVVTIGYGESLCGEEDVYGRLCENACETTTERPYTVEGVVVRVEKLALGVPLPVSSSVSLSTVHLPSRLAAAYFEDERRRGGDLRSRSGLSSSTWCHSANLDVRSTVPIALLIRSGATNLRLDPWIVRRERIDVPPSRYWAGVMGLRPWNVFLAQVLQFQCHLREIPLAGSPQGPDDPCENKTAAIGVATQFMDELAQILAKPDGKNVLTLVGEGRFQRLRDVLVGASVNGFTPVQALVDNGFVELPPAGFLPVEPASAINVEDQVRRMMGKGVDLRFLTARPDVVAQAFAESQHLARISLIRGLDDPSSLEPVDIYVPDAVVRSDTETSGPLSFDTKVSILPLGEGGFAATKTGIAIGHGGATASAIMSGVTTVTLGQSVLLSFAGAAPLSRAVGAAFAALAPIAAHEGDVAAAEDLRRLKQDFQIRRVAEVDHDALDAANRLSLNELAGKARRFMGNITAGAQAAIGDFAPAVAAGGTRQLTGWLAIDIQADLQTVEVGDRVPILGNMDYAAPANANLVVDISLKGSLEVTQVSAIAANKRRVVGKVNSATGEQTSVLLGHPANTSQQVLDAELVITLEIDGSRLASFTVDLAFKRHSEPGAGPVEIPAEGDEGIAAPRERQVRFEMQLAGAPLHVDAQLSAIQDTAARMLAAAFVSTPLPIAKAKLAENPKVLELSNPLNQTARRALDVLAAGLADPGFVDRSLKRLFPPVQTTITTHLQATRDWVMFQHRADRITTTVVPAPTTLPSRSFQVYEATLQEEGDPARLLEALRAGDEGLLKRLGVRPIDRVEFSGGTADLMSSGVQLLDSWRSAGPGDTIVCGAVALHSNSEGNLEKARMGRVAEVVSVVSSLYPTATFQLIPDVPAALDVPNVDGVMVFGTGVKHVAKMCIDVRVCTIQDLRRFGESPDSPESLNQLIDVSKRLGEVTFEGPTPQDDGLYVVIEAWKATGYPAPYWLFAMHQKDDPRAGSDQEIVDKAAAIARALDFDKPVIPSVIRQPLGLDCPVAMFFALEDRPQPAEQKVAGATHELWAILGREPRWTEIQDRLRDGVLSEDLLRQFRDMGIAQPLGFRQFNRGTREPRPDGSVTQLRQLPAPFNDTQVLDRLAIFETDSLNDDVDALMPQAEAVFEETESPGVVQPIRSPARPLHERNVLDLLILDAQRG
jgi:hypothetical protein